MVSHPTTPVVSEERVESVRRFNRFYTRQIGLLDEGLLNSPFSLTEVRTLYELAHREQSTAVELCKELGLDAGYLSRILRKFEKKRLIEKKISPQDSRQSLLSLTSTGRTVFNPLNARSTEQVSAIMGKLQPAQQEDLIRAMQTIESMLALDSEKQTSAERKNEGRTYILRPHKPGDMGWVVYRHGILYSQEYRYDERFEALVAGIVAEFIENYNPARERCWMAESNGEIVGSVFLVEKSKKVAKLRMLLVEPSARGMGIGKRLVAECIRFARKASYKTIMLWTQSELTAARKIYQQAGFELVAEEPHSSWGRKNLVAETWRLKL
ncbi:MAG: helix-turn-helix domain-containing GNAT family N-acetyltransferase [Terriglobales bacterium]|jgi:DNA-binding MarR family transcriptional regulator/N-acetylglutamate synthase-like GNAT family acetyltransferase